MKSLWGTGKQMSTLKVLLLLSMLITGLISPGYVFAVIQDNGNPDTMTVDPGTNQGVSASRMTQIRMLIDRGIRKKQAEAIQEIYKLFGSSPGTDQNNGIPSIITPTTPSTLPSPTSSFPQPTIPIATGQVNGNFTFYRQCNYSNYAMPPGCKIGTQGCCTICSMGCGFTAVAGIISSLKRPIDPPGVVQLFTQYRNSAIANSIALQQNPKSAPFQTNCEGMYIADAKTALEREGLITTNYLYRYKLGAPLSTVVSDMLPYVKSGSKIMAVTYFCDPKPDINGNPTAGCGHFIVITDINCNGSECRVTSYDPYYNPPANSVQPIDYRTHINRSPYPLYRSAFAVRK